MPASAATRASDQRDRLDAEEQRDEQDRDEDERARARWSRTDPGR